MFCKSAEQQAKASKMSTLGGKKVGSFIPGAGGIKGVIYNVAMDISEEELKANLKGAKVIKVT